MMQLSSSQGASLSDALFSSDKFFTAGIRAALKSILTAPNISATFDVSEHARSAGQGGAGRWHLPSSRVGD